ncbi:bacillithiol biosynthesis deacetylase BshB1 [Roseisolibacter sp. H3M3-2]|uniref:bacillithiol biosynthesis deacetylase BshB1 n=1 Tax=Roseisolibacter sp. H3M3-2 TaxID=3031323 RepID=UPI0023DB52AC|nr:bacillithiol biosynthesis deacetylase BshB1 [Roseisolibacter sp. H3M3-2]MDF1502670.1 bacillithiol biosynthesis deacetylase BshB1 [Roseisolibacter sp. H3M3-2]
MADLLPPLDVLAIGPHRDDVELTCAGTLLRAAAQGHRTGVLDLTQGEMGTRGSAELRAEEAAAAARVLGLATRENLGLPDSGIQNTDATRAALVQVLRRLRPAVVIAPSPVGRHPDHRLASELVRDACFLAGIVKFAPALPAHRPRKVVFSLAYREDHVKPTFVVDVTDVFERKLDAIRCYGSQFDGLTQAGEVMPNGEPLYDIVRHQAAHYGSLIRVRYGEPFLTLETMRVDDVTTLQVSTF